jgi:hypothetical protein
VPCFRVGADAVGTISTGWARYRRRESPNALAAPWTESAPSREYQEASRQEARSAEGSAKDGDGAAHQVARCRQDVARDRRQNEEDRPDHVSQAIHQGSERARTLKNALPSAMMPSTLATKSVGPKKSSPDVSVLLFDCGVPRQCGQGADIEQKVPVTCVIAASQPRSSGSQALTIEGFRSYCDRSSTCTIPGVWTCRSWAVAAAVKNIEPAE